MKKGGTGGANTVTGLIFEGKTDLATFIDNQAGYKVKEDGLVFFRSRKLVKYLKSMTFTSF